MKITRKIYTLNLKHPFKTFRSEARKSVETMVISLNFEGFSSLGEIKPSDYYFSENFDTANKVLDIAESIIGNNPFNLENILNELRVLKTFAPATIAGIDIAIHDLIGKILNIPLYKYFGLDKSKVPTTSFTIAIDSIPNIIEKLKEAENYNILKVKLGTDHDFEILKAIRDHTDAKIRIDANTAWEVDEAIEKINKMEDFRIELVEQPIKPKNFGGLRKIRENVNVPLMVDEDIIDSRNLPELIGCVDAINIKLMKCGGIREAIKMIHAAKTHGIKIMIGCMIETSISSAAAAHISPLVDYLDTDSFILINNDPFHGLLEKNGKIFLSERSGLGISIAK